MQAMIFREVWAMCNKCCATCKWWSDEYASVCVNDESDSLADFVEMNDSCEHWEERVMDDEN